MADAAISALTAVAAAAGTQELPTNDSGTTKKVTIAQMQSLLANPSSNEGDDLGTTALRWLNLFLGSGGKIDFNNGNITLTHSSGKVTLAGGGLVLAAGSTTQAPLVMDASGSLMTTPTDGAIEMDANCLYACTDAGNRGLVPVEHLIRQDSQRATFANDTNQQALFDSVAAGTLTLETGCYTFKGLIHITGMSGTSGNGKFSLIGAGTATLGTIMWVPFGYDTTSEAAPVTCAGSVHVIATQTAVNIVQAQTSLEVAFLVEGTFEVTVAGTIIPSFAQTTAINNSARTAAGSYFLVRRIGSTSMVSVGQWS